MMGDRDYRSIVQNAIDSIGRELEIEIDAKDVKNVHLKEVTGCMRRSYYDRTDAEEIKSREFSGLLSGLLRKMQYGCESKRFRIEDADVTLEGRADMVVDDIVVLFRPPPAAAGGDAEASVRMESPHAADALYLNACMWIYGKESGVIVYMSGYQKEVMFSMARNKKMFEETVRRTRVLASLLKEKKTPILEPSSECTTCPYYERCYTTKRNAKQISLHEMFGMGGDKPAR